MLPENVQQAPRQRLVQPQRLIAPRLGNLEHSNNLFANKDWEDIGLYEMLLTNQVNLEVKKADAREHSPPGEAAKRSGRWHGCEVGWAWTGLQGLLPCPVTLSK